MNTPYKTMSLSWRSTAFWMQGRSKRDCSPQLFWGVPEVPPGSERRLYGALRALEFSGRLLKLCEPAPIDNDMLLLNQIKYDRQSYGEPTLTP